MKMKRKHRKSDTMRKTGRPIGSDSVRVVPVFRDEIDIRRLGRAALRLAMELDPITKTQAPDADTASMSAGFSKKVRQILEESVSVDEEDNYEV